MVDFFAFTGLLFLVFWIWESSPDGGQDLRNKVKDVELQVKQLEGELESEKAKNRELLERIGHLQKLLGTRREEAIRTARELREGLIDALGSSAEDGIGEVDEEKIGFVISAFSGRRVEFASGHYELSELDKEAVAKHAIVLGEALSQKEYSGALVYLQGSADPNPYSGEPSVPPKNNSQLSALRAADVARVLQKASPELSKRMRVVGLGAQGKEGDHERYHKYRTVTLEVRIVGGGEAEF